MCRSDPLPRDRQRRDAKLRPSIMDNRWRVGRGMLCTLERSPATSQSRRGRFYVSGAMLVVRDKEVAPCCKRRQATCACSWEGGGVVVLSRDIAFEATQGAC